MVLHVFKVTSLFAEFNCGGVVLKLKSGSTTTNGLGLNDVLSVVVFNLLLNNVVNKVLITFYYFYYIDI